MSKVPLVYIDQMVGKVESEGYAIGGANKSVEIIKTGIKGMRDHEVTIYNVTHYGTLICSYVPSEKRFDVYAGAWSATDQSIVTSLLYIWGIPLRCKRHNETLTLI